MEVRGFLYRIASTCGVVLALASMALATHAEPTLIALDGWAGRFAHEYDYVLRETKGLARLREPVELTLTMPGKNSASWLA